MKLTYLGTGAAEGVPALFCDCETCRNALSRGGRNVRTRSQALIDDALLIDFPCDTFSHCMARGINLSGVRHCLITHVHEDHFCPQELVYLDNGFTHPAPAYGLTLYGSEDVEPLLPAIERKRLRFIRVAPFVPFSAGRYTVTALKAAHSTDHPYLYVVSDGETTLLYAHDTGLFPEETRAYLTAHGTRFDLVSLDCTEGAKGGLTYPTHMGLERNLLCREWMRREGLVDESTVMVLNHFSHNGLHAGYDDFVPIAAAHGFAVSYDGMEIER